MTKATEQEKNEFNVNRGNVQGVKTEINLEEVPYPPKTANEAIRRTTAKLIALDKFLANLDDPTDMDDELVSSVDFAQKFVPSVLDQWLTNGRPLSSKQLNKIEELYTKFELTTYENYLSDPRIPRI